MKKKDLIPNIPHHHHYVPQRYLSKWLKEDNQFYVLDICTNKIKLKGTKSICYENNLYNLGDLTKEEWEIIDYLIKDFPNYFQDIIHELGNRKLVIKSKNKINNYELKGIKDKLNEILIENKSEFDKLNIKFGEEILTEFENVLSDDKWDKLYNSDISFLKTKYDEVDFYLYIFAQVFRTPKIKKIILQSINEWNDKTNSNVSTDKMFSYFIVILSIWISNNFVLKDSHEIGFIKSNYDTSLNLITSDNPIINLCNLNDSDEIPTDYELYCPLTPFLAMLITSKDKNINTLLDDNDVMFYNNKIKENAYRYLISNDIKTLEKLLNK